MKAHIAFLRMRAGRITAFAWLSAICLAMLQAHFFLGGFRLTGDDVLFEDVILRGNIGAYIVQTASQQARIGHYLLIPLLLMGSHFSSSLAFRTFYVSLWYIDILLFSAWVATIARARIALPVFVAIVVLQPMIGYHMPPVGYPLQFGVPLLIILGMRLLWARTQDFESPHPSPARRMLHGLACVLYAAAILSSEYMMIFGLIIVLAEFSAPTRSAAAISLRGRLLRHRVDLAILVAVYVAYVIYRLCQPSRYDGAVMNGAGHYRDLLYTFFMHIASGTWLSFATRSALVPAAWPGSLASMAFCALALGLYWRHEIAKAGENASTVPVWLSGVPLLGVAALTLPVVAATKQQHWCTIDHTCSYLDSRISLFLLVSAAALAIRSLPRSMKMLRPAGAVFIALTVSAGACYAISRQQAQGMRVASQAWTRARMIACHRPAVGAVSASNFIDPDRDIPMHPIMDRDAFWQAYMHRLAKDGDCLPQVSVPTIHPPETLAAGMVEQVRLGGSGLSLLGTGWSHPEDGGVWSQGTPATLDLPIAPSAKPLTIALQLVAYAPAPGQPQKVTVSVNDIRVAQWDVAGDASKAYEIAMPTTLARTGGHIRVRLDIAQPTSPLARHASTDPRELGVMLSNLQILALPTSH
jgi:hypothetical protein